MPVAADVGFDSSGGVTTDPGRILDGGAIQVFDRCPLSLMLRLLA